MNYLSKKQEDVLKFIENHIHEHGESPSLRTIGAYFSIQVRAVQDHISAIKNKGYLKVIPKRYNGIQLLSPSQDIPIYGRVAAGKPAFAVENIEGYVHGGVDRKTDIFALRVTGDSMIDAGIHDGDVVIVKKQRSADDCDIVIAMLHDEATVKRYRFKRGQKYLEPANEHYAIIKDPFEIVGKVIELRRKL